MFGANTVKYKINGLTICKPRMFVSIYQNDLLNLMSELTRRKVYELYNYSSQNEKNLTK